jgi:hypothetical protein
MRLLALALASIDIVRGVLVSWDVDEKAASPVLHEPDTFIVLQVVENVMVNSPPDFGIVVGEKVTVAAVQAACDTVFCRGVVIVLKEALRFENALYPA